MAEKCIELKGITKAFDGQIVLDNMNLDIHENEFVTLLGPSGCGSWEDLKMRMRERYCSTEMISQECLPISVPSIPYFKNTLYFRT